MFPGLRLSSLVSRSHGPFTTSQLRSRLCDPTFTSSLYTAAMASKHIHRVTLFKVPDPANIQPILDKYSTLQESAKKVRELFLKTPLTRRRSGLLVTSRCHACLVTLLLLSHCSLYFLGLTLILCRTASHTFCDASLARLLETRGVRATPSVRKPPLRVSRI